MKDELEINWKDLLAIVQDWVCNFDSEAGCPVQTVPGRVGRGTGVGLEGDVGPHRALTRRARLRGRSRRTCSCKIENNNNLRNIQIKHQHYSALKLKQCQQRASINNQEFFSSFNSFHFWSEISNPVFSNHIHKIKMFR